MQEVNLTLERLFKIWWLLVWRGFIIGFVAGMVAGAVAGGVANAIAISLGHPEDGLIAARAAGFGAGLVVWVPIALLVLRMAIRKRYRDFRIALLPVEAH
jgi:hypothetical protein